MWILPNFKHLDKAMKQIGMQQCSSAPTPMVKEAEVKNEEEDPPLGAEEASKFRSATMSLLYLAQDVFAGQYAIKELTRDLKTPKISSQQRLKRVIRFLTGKRDWGQWFPAAGVMQVIGMYTDTNWGNCKRTRKSTSAGVMMIAGCQVYAYTRTQSIVAQSSCEAEWYGVATASAEGLFLKDLLLRLGVDLELRVHTDSSAAKAVGLRLGSGKLRSLEVKTLWVQHEVKAKRLQLYKTAGTRNIADLGTKAYAAARSSSSATWVSGSGG